MQSASGIRRGLTASIVAERLLLLYSPVSLANGDSSHLGVAIPFYDIVLSTQNKVMRRVFAFPAAMCSSPLPSVEKYDAHVREVTRFGRFWNGDVSVIQGASGQPSRDASSQTAAGAMNHDGAFLSPLAPVPLRTAPAGR
jgi:hypothetical protein